MDYPTAQHLADARRASGLKQEEVAERLGVTRQAVSKWERGESAPETDNLIALARLYDMSLDELLGLRGPQSPSPANDDGAATTARAGAQTDGADAQRPGGGAGVTRRTVVRALVALVGVIAVTALVVSFINSNTSTMSWNFEGTVSDISATDGSFTLIVDPPVIHPRTDAHIGRVTVTPNEATAYRDADGSPLGGAADAPSGASPLSEGMYVLVSFPSTRQHVYDDLERGVTPDAIELLPVE